MKKFSMLMLVRVDDLGTYARIQELCGEHSVKIIDTKEISEEGRVPSSTSTRKPSTRKRKDEPHLYLMSRAHKKFLSYNVPHKEKFSRGYVMKWLQGNGLSRNSLHWMTITLTDNGYIEKATPTSFRFTKKAIKEYGSK